MKVLVSSFGSPHPSWSGRHRELFIDWDEPRVCGLATNTASPVAADYPVDVMAACLAPIREGAAAEGESLVEDMLLALDRAAHAQADAANAADWSESFDGLWDFGCEAVFVSPSGAHLGLGAVGGVRVLRLRGGSVEVVFAGHTLVEMAAEKGVHWEESRLTAAENVLTRALGTTPEPPELHLAALDVRAGDRFLLATIKTLSALSRDDLVAAMGGALESSAQRVVESGCAAYQAREGRATDGQAMTVEIAGGRLPTARVVH